MMNLLRRFVSLLLVCILLTSMALYVRGEEITQSTLNNACSALESFLYPSVYQSSPYYREYVSAYTQAKIIASEQNVTSKQVSDAYYKLRDSYILVMKSTYDFSGLEQIASIESWIDTSLYEEESLQAFLEEAAKCREEMSNPHLYPMETDSTEDYIRLMQEKLNDIEHAAVEKYNQIELKSLPRFISKSAALSLTEAMEDTIHSCGIEKNCTEKEEYENSLEAVKAALNDQEISNDDFQIAVQNVLVSYQSYLRVLLDFEEIERSYADFESIDETLYTEKSYQLVTKAFSRLSDKLDQPVFFHVSSDVTGNDRLSLAQAYIDAMDDETALAKASLIEVKKVEQLNTLIAANKSLVSGAELTKSEQALKKAIKRGENLLKNDSYTAEDLDQTIELIQITANKVNKENAANGEIETGILRNKKTTIRLILIFTIVTFVLSVILAVVLSLNKFGTVDFRK